MNTKDPKQELESLIDDLKETAERLTDNLETAAKQAVAKAENFIKALEFEKALPYNQPETIAKMLKSDHTLVGLIDMSHYGASRSEEVSLSIDNYNRVSLGSLKLPMGKHRVVLFIFEEKAP